METTDKCYCLDMFRKTDPNVKGECLKMKCGRYKLEKKREGDHSGKPISLKEINRRKKAMRDMRTGSLSQL